ncbi:MAG: MinD/ParA family protein [Phycisphaerales bacterium]|nr:MAG: MinD/ParA family protein [Phycisphaerales bacterium]
MNDQATQLRREMQNRSQSIERREEASAYRSMNDSVAESMPPSMAKGAVSFGPMPMRHRPPRKPAPQAPIKLARAIAVTSGKGGVGKSNLAVNLAVSLAQMQLKVCLLDADLGLANADVLCNLSPKLTLEHVVAGKCRLWEAMLLAPGGFRLIPGASGVARLAELGPTPRRNLLQQLAALERVADIIIIDTGAGLNSNVLSFAAAAHTVLVTTTPEPTALTDGYGMVKTLVAKSPRSEIDLVVNMVADEQEGRDVHGRVSRVCRTFLGREIGFAGTIPTDPAVGLAVRQRMPFVLSAPESHATWAVRQIARQQVGLEVENRSAASTEAGGFFSRVAGWFSRSGENR